MSHRLPVVFSIVLFEGGSLAKVAYLSEVRRIRPRHYSSSGSFMGSKSTNCYENFAVESDADKQVCMNFDKGLLLRFSLQWRYYLYKISLDNVITS